MKDFVKAHKMKNCDLWWKWIPLASEASQDSETWIKYVIHKLVAYFENLLNKASKYYIITYSEGFQASLRIPTIFQDTELGRITLLDRIMSVMNFLRGIKTRILKLTISCDHPQRRNILEKLRKQNELVNHGLELQLWPTGFPGLL